MDQSQEWRRLIADALKSLDPDALELLAQYVRRLLATKPAREADTLSRR